MCEVHTKASHIRTPKNTDSVGRTFFFFFLVEVIYTVDSIVPAIQPQWRAGTDVHWEDISKRCFYLFFFFGRSHTWYSGWELSRCPRKSWKGAEEEEERKSLHVLGLLWTSVWPLVERWPWCWNRGFLISGKLVGKDSRRPSSATGVSLNGLTHLASFYMPERFFREMRKTIKSDLGFYVIREVPPDGCAGHWFGAEIKGFALPRMTFFFGFFFLVGFFLLMPWLVWFIILWRVHVTCWLKDEGLHQARNVMRHIKSDNKLSLGSKKSLLFFLKFLLSTFNYAMNN